MGPVWVWEQPGGTSRYSKTSEQGERRQQVYRSNEESVEEKG